MNLTQEKCEKRGEHKGKKNETDLEKKGEGIQGNRKIGPAQ